MWRPQERKELLLASRTAVVNTVEFACSDEHASCLLHGQYSMSTMVVGASLEARMLPSAGEKGGRYLIIIETVASLSLSVYVSVCLSISPTSIF